jgi:hypothetical protein
MKWKGMGENVEYSKPTVRQASAQTQVLQSELYVFRRNGSFLYSIIIVYKAETRNEKIMTSGQWKN